MGLLKLNLTLMEFLHAAPYLSGFKLFLNKVLTNSVCG